MGPIGTPEQDQSSELLGAHHGTDLDALIGDLLGEAARRRAESGFPLDEEAHLGMELDGQAPRPLPAKLERLAQTASQIGPGPAAPDAGRAGRAGRVAAKVVEKAVAAEVGPVARAVSSLGDVLATGFRVVAGQLTQLDGRVRQLEDPDPPPPNGPPGAPTPAGGWLDEWRGQLEEDLPVRSGRVLYSGSDPEAVVGGLRRVGIDAYGLSSAATRYQTHPDVRRGEVLEHLRAVSDRGLGAVVLAGGLRIGSPAVLRELAAELARVTGQVVIVSEAPWWWRGRVGPEEADLSPDRPLAAETWLAGLHRAGFRVSGAYDADGTSYRVTAHLPED
jgi:hypothetical protein